MRCVAVHMPVREGAVLRSRGGGSAACAAALRSLDAGLKRRTQLAESAAGYDADEIRSWCERGVVY